ncbi:MAG: FAD-dependent oxidoreductase [Limimaricola sp.]|uniref:NAD(P)/FAD-dependent oxidoreductase n=1 Tax=Limimaricola sp. TaxID=2211665 RepID=UPI001D8210CD|nr:FAD-binding oxidoreductase [Limimaricola sp.]MBI1418525.1 FAD-dependent oxidoreductase [Limimaricola sp.]
MYAPFPISEATPVAHPGPLPASADAVVIGGGIAGVMTAWNLAQRGLRAVLVEKGRIAGEQSSRNWGWIRQQGRDPAELPIMIEAAAEWRRIAPTLDTDIGLRQTGVLYLAEKQAQIAAYEDWLTHARAHDLDTRLLGAAEVTALLPGATKRWQGGLWTASDMRAEPWLAVPALARAAARDGVVIVENCAARGIDVAAGRVAGVVTEQGRVAAPAVVVAGGAWSSLLLRRHGIAIPQLSVRATAAATAPLPEVFAGGAVDDEFAFRRRADGGYTLAPADFHEMFIGPDAFRALRRFLPQLAADPFGTRYYPAAPRDYPDAWGTPRRWSEDTVSPFERMRVLNPAPNARKLRELAARFQELYPALGPVALRTGWAGMIDTLPDVVPVLDRAEALPGLVIATGLSGHGFGIGPGVGRVAAALVAGDDPGHDLHRFRLSRFSDGSRLELGPTL